MRRFALLFLMVPLVLHAQYSEEWHVSQNYFEAGSLYFDLNHDGVQELTKHLYNTVTVFDGANNYQVIWSIVDPNHDELVLWDVTKKNAANDSVAVFLANDILTNLTTKVIGYNLFSSSPIWQTDDFAGYYSYLDSDDLDGDGITELVLGVNDYQELGGNYLSRFRVISSATGTVEYTSGVYNGYMIGPFVGNMDGDGAVEILFNIYYSDSTSTMYVYSFAGSYIAQNNPIPNDVSVQQNYPNPFNASTSIPLQLARESDVEVTVVNVQGRMVGQILSGRLAAGQHRLFWNGMDAAGHPAASGMYFYEVRIGDNRIRKPMVLLK